MPLEAIELRAAAGRAAAVAWPTCSAPTPTSASRTRSARPTATSCAASGARSTTRRTWSPIRATSARSRRCSAWCAERAARGDSLRRRDERGRGRRAASRRRLPGARHDRPARASTACSRWTRSRGRRGSRPAPPGPALEDQLREQGLTLRHFPQSFEFSTLGGWIATRAGGHFATLYTHIDDLVESVRAITPGGLWESRRLPGLGRRPQPRSAAARLRGNPRGDHGGLGAGPGAPPLEALARGRVRRRSRPAPRRSASWRSPASTPPTAVCSTRPSPRSPTPGRRGRRCSCSGSSRRTTRSMGRWRSRSRRRGTTAGTSRSASRARAAARTAGGERGGPGGRLAARLPRRARTCATRSSRCGVLSDTFETAITWERFAEFHAERDGDRPRRDRRGLRRAAGRPGLAAPLVPLHARLPRRPGALLHGALPRPGAAARSSSGTRSRRRSRRR